MPLVAIAVTNVFRSALSRSLAAKTGRSSFVGFGGRGSRVGSYNNLNPGQKAKLDELSKQVIDAVDATAEVDIAGRDVDVTVEFDFRIDQLMPDYLCDIGDLLTEEMQLVADKLESGRGYDSSKIIDQAFKSL